MYFAPVVPPRLVAYLPSSVRRQLVIANIAANNLVSYTQRPNRDEAIEVMLDNPVHEKLDFLPISIRYEIARYLSAKIVIAPDVIGDPQKSMILLEAHM